MPDKKITTLDMELALQYEFKTCLVVPNVSWSFFTHECDLIALTKSNYCSEIEIKISKSDLKADLKKPHKHIDGRGYKENKIKYLWFAIPEHMKYCVDLIPEHAGIIIVMDLKIKFLGGKSCHMCRRIRNPKQQSSYKFSEKERIKLLEVMSYRIWGLKEKLSKLTGANNAPT